jgi:hypothetical protein
VVEMLTVIASKSLYLADKTFFLDSQQFSVRLGLSIVKIGLSFSFVISCTNDLQFQLGWPYLRN